MSLQYQASDKNKEDCVFAQFIKQSTWDEARHIGGFKESMEDPTKKVTVKLEFVELGAILDCLDRNRPFKTFHDDGKGGKSITFGPWMDTPTASLDDKPASAPVLKGYSFGVTINNKEDSTNPNKFFIGLTLAEGRYIREFLIWAMQQHFQKTTYQNHLKAPATKSAAELPKPSEGSLVDF